MNGLERRLIDVDGATLEVFLGGTGEPVVCRSHPFEPMTAGSTWPWEDGMGRLIAVNPRGVGGSSGGPDPNDFTFTRHADDLEAVRRHLGVSQWVVWGESGGAVVALIYALRYPAALRGLVAAYIGASGRRVAEDERSVLSPHHPPYGPLIATATKSGAGPAHPAVLGAIEQRLATASWRPLGSEQWLLVREGQGLVVCPDGEERVWAAFEQFPTMFDVRERLGEIEVPTLVVAGRHDSVVPLEHVERLAAGLPDAELVVQDDSGHADADPSSPDGARYQEAVRRFLARLTRGAPG